MATIRAREPGWADVLHDNAVEWATARRLVDELTMKLGSLEESITA